MTVERLLGLATIVFGVLFTGAASAAAAGAPHLDGSELGLIWVVPFCRYPAFDRPVSVACAGILASSFRQDLGVLGSGVPDTLLSGLRF